MVQTQETDVVGNLFPFSELQNLSVSFEQTVFQQVSETNSSEDVMELPVNNYLKTPEEIEMEFQYGVSPRKVVFQQKKSSRGISNITTDGYLNIHNLDKALSGFMEENY